MIRKLSVVVVTLGLFYVTCIYGVSFINSNFLIAFPEKKPPLWEYQSNRNFLSSEALVVSAENSLKDNDVESAIEKTLKSLRVDPSNGRAAAFLMSLMVKEGELTKADAMADLSSELWPAHTFTRSRLAEYWISKDRLDKVMSEWNVVLIRNPKVQRTLFPILAALIQDDNSAAIFNKFIAAPPVWWNNFFIQLSRDLPLDRLKQVYSARASSDTALNDIERRYYVNRLIKEKLWGEAFDTWYVGLSSAESKYSGYLFDGGFESGLYNQAYTWTLKRSKNPLIKADITYGIKGRKALKVVLRGKEPLNFRHVSQRLLLEPGDYEFSLRYRADSIKAQKGLTWRLRCLDTRSLITETDPISVTSPWATLRTKFTIDSDCPVQQLILESTSKFSHERSITGSLWFDDLMIRKIRTLND